MAFGYWNFCLKKANPTGQTGSRESLIQNSAGDSDWRRVLLMAELADAIQLAEIDGELNRIHVVHNFMQAEVGDWSWPICPNGPFFRDDFIKSGGFAGDGEDAADIGN